jgi:AmiR/NasT family two-component response regulator
MSSIRRLYEDLRSISVAVVYPPGEEREILIDQLKRIGCRLKIVWPFPGEPPTSADVIFFQVSQELQDSSTWCASSVDATLIALSDYESPTTLKLLLDTSAHGVITRPFRSSGILSTLVLARSAQGFQARLQGKVRKLEDTIRSRRQIEKAIRVLSESQQLSETQAYEHMRARATTLRVTVAEVSAMIIEAHEAMEKLGLGRPNAKP